MTKDNIICLPNQNLRERSIKVGLITDEIKLIVESMKEATLNWEDNRKHEVGVALAAVQISKKIRAIIIRNNFDDKADRTFHAFINPKITKYEGDLIEDFEGCLSVRDIYGKVKRYSKVRVSAIDLDNKAIRMTAEGFLARIFQHEIDHTNGIVFIDHIKDNPEAFYKLDKEGHLIRLDYEKDIKQNNELW